MADRGRTRTRIKRQLKEGEQPGLNRHWRGLFLDILAETSNVTEAARRAGINPSRAYKVRREEPGFARDWMQALWEGYSHLELEVLRRLREGDTKVGKQGRFDFANAIRLLNAHRENAARARRGSARGFRICDPFDHSSNAMTDQPTQTDQPIGTGDGLTADFALIKTYGTGDDAQQRRITRPRASSLLVSVDGVAVTNWALDELGMLRFETAPTAGSAISAGFLFDVPVRFAEDRLDISGVNFAAGEAPSVPLIEIRESE